MKTALVLISSINSSLLKLQKNYYSLFKFLNSLLEIDLNFTESPGEKRQGFELSFLLKSLLEVLPIIFHPPGLFVRINVAKFFYYTNRTWWYFDPWCL